MINHFLVSIIAYLGLVGGFIILYFAPEEKKPGMKYFTWINYALALFGVLLLNSFLFANYLAIILSVIFLVLGIYFRDKIIYFSYLYFGIGLFLLIGQYGYEAFAALIFAYGLTAGAILYEKKWKNFYKVLYLFYFVVISMLPFLFSYS